jgi:hypothetical protein
MEAACSSDMLVSAYKTALCHDPEGQKQHEQRQTVALGFPLTTCSLHIPSYNHLLSKSSIFMVYLYYSKDTWQNITEGSSDGKEKDKSTVPIENAVV